MGDLRKTKRLVKVAQQAAARPDGSTPDQSESWSDCKADYRLMDCDGVTHAEIIRPHCELTKQSCSPGSTKLILCDTTEIDFKREVEATGPVGQGTGRGFFLHAGLMRDARSGKIEGMAGSGRSCFIVSRKANAFPRTRSDVIRKESQSPGGELIDAIGPPPADVKWIHVCDRGADDYEVYCRAFRNRCGWVVRVARLNRKVEDMDGKRLELGEHIARQPVQGSLSVDVPRQGKRQTRQAQVTIRFAPLRMPTPSRGNDWIKANAPAVGCGTQKRASSRRC